MIFHRIARLIAFSALAAGCTEDINGIKKDAGLGTLDGLVDALTIDENPIPQPYFNPYSCDGDTIALFHFDDPSPFVDACNGTVILDNNTESTVGRNPDFGQARNLSGNNSYLDILNAPEFNFGYNDFTVEAWFRFNGLSEGLLSGTYDLMGKSTPGSPNPTNGWALQHEVERNNATWCFFYGNDSKDYVGIGHHRINDDEWHHLRCERYTRNGLARLFFSVDGGRFDQDDQEYNLTNSSVLKVGNTENGIKRGAPYFPGDVDELRISRTARSFE